MCSLFKTSLGALGLAVHSGHLPATESLLLNEVPGRVVGAVIYEEIIEANR